MNWEISADGKQIAIVKLPSTITRNQWLPVTINDSNFTLQWDPQRLTCFLRDSKGIERPIKVRSASLEQFSGESQRQVAMEISTDSKNMIDRAELSCEPYIPGSAFRKEQQSSAGAVVRSPMVGKILSVDLQDGDLVTKGQQLVVIEAMKMENKINAPMTGVVEQLKAKVGDQVGVGDQLLKISPKTTE